MMCVMEMRVNDGVLFFWSFVVSRENKIKGAMLV